MVRRCWVNFQCRGVLLIWIEVGQGSIALAVGAGGGCLDIFSLNYHFSFLSPSLWETARYRLKYCLKGPLSPNNQPTNQLWYRLAMSFSVYLISSCIMSCRKVSAMSGYLEAWPKTALVFLIWIIVRKSSHSPLQHCANNFHFMHFVKWRCTLSNNQT